MNKVFPLLLIISLFCNCSKYEKSQISDIEKLSSPSKQFDVYLYSIGSGMSFGSTVNALQIVKYQEKPDFYNGEFFRVPNSGPFQIKWDNNNLKIKTISNIVTVAENQPFKTELYTYKGVKIRNDIYTQFSGTAIVNFKFSEFYEKNQNIVFKNYNDSLVFDTNKSQLSIGLNYLEASTFERNKFHENKGLDFEFYKLLPIKKLNFSKFEKYQPLAIIEK
ncbi:hypothetical protein [Kaistella jeonii]|uniref:Uncharacterized protein n=1 Tax=Kaistella jeonii TaxID=266749 RepID=A0A0C1F826_9FLAO|nr:hypothetical protein [Kaistella jeonii]KIA88048.1 hypothetical protein OA86_12675 [Kaistella jeonii]SFC31250.1 hypothetical protein SAMN05421876_11329 [Kaistella jeonii]VEI95593.1 Uncharacterised protein [Kaistella jeonii]